MAQYIPGVGLVQATNPQYMNPQHGGFLPIQGLGFDKSLKIGYGSSGSLCNSPEKCITDLPADLFSASVVRPEVLKALHNLANRGENQKLRKK